MPTFDTPGPITVDVSLILGELRVTAGDRTDTVVDVRPTDPGSRLHAEAARSARVRLAGGVLVVRASRRWRPFRGARGGESIDVHVEAPSGSDVRFDAGIGGLYCTGRLGGCRAKVGVGDFDVREVDGALEIHAGAGAVTVGRVSGRADIRTGSGPVHVDVIGDAGVVRSAGGETWIGRAEGDLRLRSAHGDIVVERAGAALVAKASSGDVTVGRAERGPVVVETSYGDVEVGVPDGAPVHLDLDAPSGTVYRGPDSTEDPDGTGGSGEPVDVRARTSSGDVVVRRVPAARTGG